MSPYCHATLCADCPICERWQSDPTFRAALATIPPPGGGAPPLCRHRAESPLPKAKQIQLGLGVLKDYFACAQGHGPKGYVCGCSGTCNPGCVDYQLPDE